MERLRYIARASGADQRLLVRETADAVRGMRGDPAGLVVTCRRIVERHPTSGPLWWWCSSVLASPEPFRVAGDLAVEVEHDPTPDHLYDALPDDATVCVVGWPDLIGDAVMRRGDVRVLAIDADDEGSSFVRRLHRADVEADVVPAAGMSAAVAAADVVLVEALACGSGEVLAATGSRAMASVAYCSEAPLWLVAGRGRRLPDQIIVEMRRRIDDGARGWVASAESVPAALFAAVIGPFGWNEPGSDAPAAEIWAPEVWAPECPLAAELLRPSPI